MQSLVKQTLIVLFLVGVTIGMASCKKEPGVGGNATIYGKVLVKDYNSTFTVLQETYYGPAIWVYIQYGDDLSYGDRVQTGYDGTFEFKYLKEGTYTLYVYSKDSTLTTNAPIPVIQETEITSKNQEVELPDFEIFD